VAEGAEDNEVEVPSGEEVFGGIRIFKKEDSTRKGKIFVLETPLIWPNLTYFDI